MSTFLQQKSISHYHTQCDARAAPPHHGDISALQKRLQFKFNPHNSYVFPKTC